MTSLLVLAALGQCYQNHYQSYYQGYGYNYGYVAPAVVYKSYTVATGAADPYYAALVAARAQEEKRAQAKAEVNAQLAQEVGGLRQELAGLRQFLANQPPPVQPQPQPQPINPMPPPSFAPAQPSPQVPPAPVTPPPPVPPKNDPQAYAAPSSGTPGLSTVDSRTTVSPPPAVFHQAPGVAILQQRCANCHSGSAAQKGFAIFDDDGRLALRGLQWVKVEKRTAGALPGLPQMPPRHPLSADEFAAVRAEVARHDADVLAELSAKGP